LCDLIERLARENHINSPPCGPKEKVMKTHSSVWITKAAAVAAMVCGLGGGLSSLARAGVAPTFDLYTSSVYAGTGNSATCRVVNVGLSAIDVGAQLVDVNGNVLAGGMISVQAQHNGAVTGYEFVKDIDVASVYCRFKVAYPQQVRASLTLMDGWDFPADTIAVAEAR
jgi:hypothetical protein